RRVAVDDPVESGRPPQEMTEHGSLWLIALRFLHPASVEPDLADHRRVLDGGVGFCQPVDPAVRLPRVDSEGGEDQGRPQRSLPSHPIRVGIDRHRHGEHLEAIDLLQCSGELVAVSVEMYMGVYEHTSILTERCRLVASFRVVTRVARSSDLSPLPAERPGGRHGSTSVSPADSKKWGGLR